MPTVFSNGDSGTDSIVWRWFARRPRSSERGDFHAIWDSTLTACEWLVLHKTSVRFKSWACPPGLGRFMGLPVIMCLVFRTS